MNLKDLKSLAKIADSLDVAGEHSIASRIDALILKSAENNIDPDVAFESGGRDWYKAKPTNMQEFNAFLAALMMDYNGGRADVQEIFNAENLPYETRVSGERIMSDASELVPSRWTRGTTKAFRQFAEWANKPFAADYRPGDQRPKVDDRGRHKSPWVLYAEENNYAPSLAGMFEFWLDNAEGISMGITRELDTFQSANRKMRDDYLGEGVPDLETEEDLERALTEMDLDEARFYAGLANDGGLPDDVIMEKKDVWLAALDSSEDEADLSMASDLRSYIALAPKRRALASTPGDYSEMVLNYPEAAALLRFPVSPAKSSDPVGPAGWYYPHASPPKFEYVETEANANSGLRSMEGDHVLSELESLGFRMVKGPATMDRESLRAALTIVENSPVPRAELMPSETSNARLSDSAEISDDAADGFDARKLSADFSLYKGLVRR